MPSPDCFVIVSSFRGWISTARSSLFATKTTASIGSFTSNLQLGHKTYHCVDLPPIYSTSLKSSLSDHSCTSMRRSKFQRNFSMQLTRHKCCSNPVTASTIKIVFLQSTSSKKNQFHWKTHASSCVTWSFYIFIYVPLLLPADVICDVTYHVNPSRCHLWRHTTTSHCHVNPSRVIYVSF